VPGANPCVLWWPKGKATQKFSKKRNFIF